MRPQPGTSIYLDHAASSPAAPEVIEAMLPWLRDLHANPHAEHLHGQRALEAVEEAREHVAALVGANPDEITFTSGATESNNLAIQGYVGRDCANASLCVTPVEHKSIGAVAQVLKGHGADVRVLPVTREGDIELVALSEVLGAPPKQRRLVAFAHANNELGTVQPIDHVVAAAHAMGWRTHVDAAQSAGKVFIDVVDDDLDSVSISSHKLAGPMGIGALFIARDFRPHVSPLMFGGGQEAGLRPGTVPVFLAVGFGTAAALATSTMKAMRTHLEEVSGRFTEALAQGGVKFELLGHSKRRIPGHLCLRLPGVDAADLLQRTARHFSASLGSACSAGEISTSHVLRAIGLDEATARQVLRISFGRTSEPAEAERAAVLISQVLASQEK